MKKNFTIRVYGIYINEKDELLVSDELVFKQYITKFPGGGLEFGEGPAQCLEREMMEETGIPFKVEQHFYTTDFFVHSAFDPNIQVISIYFRVKPEREFNIRMGEKPFDFKTAGDDSQSFRWIPLVKLSSGDFTLPIDKHVADLLLALSVQGSSI